MKVLVTGNLGFVGSVVTEHLQSLGHEVVGLDTGFFKDCLAVPAWAPREQIFADVRSVEQLPQVHAVVHLAALSNDPLGELNPDITYAINVGGSVSIARLAKKQGIPRFIFASSCSMYGISDSGAVDETSTQNPQTAYATSKVLAEREILAMTSEEFWPISFRFATAYGFSPRPRLDIVVNNLISSAIARGELVLESDGSPWRPLINVTDMARAIAGGLAADAKRIAGEAFNVGCDDENYQVRDIAKFVSEALGDLPLKIGTARGADTRSYKVSFEKFAKTFPDSVPHERLSAAASTLGRRYSDSLDKSDYEAIRFFRLRQIKYLLESGLIDADLLWNAAPPTATV